MAKPRFDVRGRSYARETIPGGPWEVGLVFNSPAGTSFERLGEVANAETAWGSLRDYWSKPPERIGQHKRKR